MKKNQNKKVKDIPEDKPLSFDERKVLLILLANEEMFGPKKGMSPYDIKMIGMMNDMDSWDEGKFSEMIKKLRGNKSECFDFLFGKQEVIQ